MMSRLRLAQIYSKPILPTRGQQPLFPGFWESGERPAEEEDCVGS